MSEQLRILVAEDAAELRFAVTLVLQVAGFLVLLAANGAEAVQEAVQQVPDLVLMDLSMPEMDGWTAMRALGADPRTAAIPVLAMSAHAASTEALREAGFRGFLGKPFLTDQLLRAVRAVLEAAPGGADWIEIRDLPPTPPA